MSRDLRIVGSEWPDLDALGVWLVGLGRWDVRVGGGVTSVHRLTRGEISGVFSLDGPVRVEAEDLPPELASAVLVPRWLIEINVPLGASDAVWKMALRVGRRLADEMVGVVFDPQEDEIVWPRSKNRRLARVDKSPASTDIDFSWAIPEHGSAESLPRDLIALLRGLLPEALPRRYGSFEPLQHRFDDGEEAFYDLWRSEQASWVGMVSWNATMPVRSGSVFFPSLREPEEGVLAGSLRLTIDGRVFEDSRWRDLAVTLLDQVGGLTNALYARARVEQHYTGGIPASESDNRAPGIVSRTAWRGIPDHPAWLMWIGETYVDAIGDAVPSEGTTLTEQGLLIALSEEPRFAVELLPWHDRFPVEFCRQPETPMVARPMATERLIDPIRIADHIPVIDPH
ncbi:MAG: hypothetical protein GXP34_01060 [Actinobacteria bacterium]|nr:hypothetical protein [Actinomycetota bacterium]